jgi:hypothetical protein
MRLGDGLSRRIAPRGALRGIALCVLPLSRACDEKPAVLPSAGTTGGNDMSERLNRFLGDTPVRVLLRLLVLSFIVGLVLSALNIRPIEVWWWVERAILRIWNMGFAFLGEAFGYLVIGALVVVPIFLLMRLFRLGGGRRAE